MIQQLNFIGLNDEYYVDQSKMKKIIMHLGFLKAMAFQFYMTIKIWYFSIQCKEIKIYN